MMRFRSISMPGTLRGADPVATVISFFAVSAWGPYLYWGLVAERGDFERVAAPLPILCALASLAGLVAAWRTRRSDARAS